MMTGLLAVNACSGAPMVAAGNGQAVNETLVERALVELRTL